MHIKMGFGSNDNNIHRTYIIRGKQIDIRMDAEVEASEEKVSKIYNYIKELGFNDITVSKEITIKNEKQKYKLRSKHINRGGDGTKGNDALKPSTEKLKPQEKKQE